MSRRSVALVVGVVLAALGAYWVVEMRRVGEFPFDDTYITLRYGKHLAEHGHLSFNLDDRVDGFTSQGWTVILAAALKLGAHGVEAAVFLSKLCGYLGGVAAAVLALCLGAHPLLAVCAAGLTVSSPGWMSWSAPGMETPYAGMCAALLLADLARHPLPGRLRVLALVAASTARPDCGVLVGVVLLHDLVRIALSRDLDARRRAFVGFLLAGALVVGIFAAHWAYYGYPLPNTYYAKLGGVRNFETGVPDLKKFLHVRNIGLAPLVGVALCAMGRPAQRVPALALSLWFGACAYSYAAAGGDYMEGFRFYQPLVPAAWAVLLTGVDRLVGVVPWKPFRAIAGVVAITATLSLLVRGHESAKNALDPLGGPITYARRWTRAGEALARCFPPSTSISIRAAGVIPYLTDFRAYDTLGLNTREVALHPGVSRPKDVGHNKEASASQVVAWHPDLVVNHPHFSVTDETGQQLPTIERPYAGAGYLPLCIRVGTEHLCPLARPGITTACER